MTDTSYPLKPLNGADHPRAPLANSLSPALHDTVNSHKYAVQEEDDGLIDCFCGYSDDDGATVCCDQCNTWQHISCYYPKLEGGLFPDDIQHFCINCRPRTVDKALARSVQKQRLERQNREQLQQQSYHNDGLTNGVKRGTAKNHKKKVKDAAVAATTNGWSTDHIRADRNTDSPREQGPPTKRPRTSHRHSDSTTSTAKGHSRKRNASTAHPPRRSPSRSSEAPVEKYSEEFLRCHMEDDWTTIDANLYQSIAITTELSAMLSEPDEDFQARYGPQKSEVFNRWDGDLDDIPGRAEIVIVPETDESVRYGDTHPHWKYLTVQMPIANGAYIGELKGQVGYKREYQADPANRWAELRHPEPFVFFHPKLPIFVDARNEGTTLRYIRRSCDPNARLQILVTDQTDYHFCFMATKQIDPGVELALPWDTADGFPELIRNEGIRQDEVAMLSDWVSTVLSNCGPCACHLPESECLMSRLDRRGRDRSDDAQNPIKAPKTKKRRTGNNVSPLNTNALNSRSGSEARRVDPDEDAIDSRSNSGSAGQRSLSREITPHTHALVNGMTEMSERERKKLAKEEEMFKRQEEEQTGKQAKKKRNSAGTPSATQTPAASTASKAFVFPNGTSSRQNTADASTSSSKQSSLPPRAGATRRPRAGKTTSTKNANRVVKPSKPVYVDSSMQCDMDDEEAQQARRLSDQAKPRRRVISARQHLLELCARNSERRRSSDTTLMSVAEALPAKIEASDSADVPITNHDADAKHEPGTTTRDVEMEDARVDKTVTSISPKEASSSPVLSHKSPIVSSPTTASLEPPAPPWPSATPAKHVDMHVPMPPPFSHSSSSNLTARPTSSSGFSAAIAQSPAPLPTPSTPLFFPSVLASVQAGTTTPSIAGPGAAAPLQSPAAAAKKKLSLSDWSRRNKANKENEASSTSTTTLGKIAERDSSPASSVVAATEKVGGNANGDADVKMEDAGDDAAVAPAVAVASAAEVGVSEA